MPGYLLADLSQMMSNHICPDLDDMSQKGAICTKITWTICHNFFSTWTICHTYFGRFVTSHICHNFILDDLSQVLFLLDDMSKKRTVIWDDT